MALWYGKGPGVDRSGDAFKHGNFAGTSRHGAVVILSGEDHEAKSSTLPYQDDYAFVSAGIPIVYPASTGEFLDLGLHAIAMSRFSGCWVAMKLVGALADGGETVIVGPDQPSIVFPELVFGGRPFKKSTDFTFFLTQKPRPGSYGQLPAPRRRRAPSPPSARHLGSYPVVPARRGEFSTALPLHERP